MVHPLLYLRHRIKLALIVLVHFVVSRPWLFAHGVRLLARYPRLKFFIWRIYKGVGRPSAVDAHIPAEVPVSAKALLLQLTRPEGGG